MKSAFKRAFARPEKRAAPAPLPAHIEAIRQKALKGHHLEIVQWGQVLLESIYVPKDPAAALEWFTSAANAGFGPGYNMRGRCYQFGWGCTQNLTEAARCYAAAAHAGDEWGRYNLGIMVMRGIGQPRNLAKACALFQEAAHKGHAKSINLYARFLEEGWIVAQDRAAAAKWYKLSAESGDYRGQHNYATLLLENGQQDEALAWWHKAVVDATSDILLAMRQKLLLLGDRRDHALEKLVCMRLTDMNIEV
ncbi:hypothetical protein AA106555_1803 [Neokomagataea thailandica NBRC 106555]|uniref:Sel1 repeat family protein n=2 Tax=Neokomagataea TaxID=1223423 RepID=A0A4Y6VB99_9PROT|nr:MULTISPECIES: tetratricopeptide repeat protein [Neokomagataea]QDH25645.1 sel1 repeat family protein [Neokomagataea tanensis]GBR54746.1 hypothetical protein AA106555_1803 [Neokomagataea thailandica NBRC 106555]